MDIVKPTKRCSQARQYYLSVRCNSEWEVRQQASLVISIIIDYLDRTLYCGLIFLLVV